MIILNLKTEEFPHTEAKTIIDFFPQIKSATTAENYVIKHPFLIDDDKNADLYNSEVIISANTAKKVIILPVDFSYGNDEKNEPEMLRVKKVLEDILKTLKSPIAINIAAVNLTTRKHLFWRNLFAEHGKMFEIYE